MKGRNITKAVLVSLSVGALVGASLSYFLLGSKFPQSAEKEQKPLYWVAPMDPNYRRDGPGKSPMGMDLVPVYQESAEEGAEGVVKVSPALVHNFGVRTVEVKNKNLKPLLRTVGYVQYDEDEIIHVHPRISGWVEKLHLKSTGDPVKKGRPLYALYSPELVNVQEELVQALKANNKGLIEVTSERLRALQFDDTLIRNLIQTRKITRTVTFFAEKNGVIKNLNIREGFYVEPGTTLLSIASLNSVWLEVELFERDAPFVSLGNPVRIRSDYNPGKEWRGQVGYIYPTLNSRTRALRIRVRLDNPQNDLKPNMYTRLEIETTGLENQLVIPLEALIRTGHQDRAVMALGEGRFKSVIVKVGEISGGDAVILEGLAEGDRVVSSSQFLLDSESNKQADFMRMEELPSEDKTSDEVQVLGEIESLDVETRIAVVQHAPIEQWGWPEMLMDFTVADSIDLTSLVTGVPLLLDIKRIQGAMPEIRGFKPVSEQE